MLYIAPYNLGSESARSLADELDVLRIRGHKIMPRNTMIINWGNSELDPRTRGNLLILNRRESVARAKNKTTTLGILNQAGIKTPEFTTSMSEARSWMDEDTIIYGRHTVTGQGGEGIEIITADSNFPRCPLYTKGIIKAHEYRVHVFKNKAINYAKKRRRDGVETNPYIKNHENGWVFCQEDVLLPPAVHDAAVRAVAAVGLDFAAVDVLLKQDVPYVLELNTAPGIEGRTLESYTRAFKEAYATFNQRQVSRY